MKGKIISVDSSNGQVTAPELVVLKKIAEIKDCMLTVKRKSDRKYDLEFTGTYGPNGKYRSNMKFRAWLILSAIDELTIWPHPDIACMTDYPDMAMDGDWSGVRDTDRDRLWEIFEKHVLPQFRSEFPDLLI